MTLRLPRILAAVSLRRLGSFHDVVVAFLSISASMALAWGWTNFIGVWQIWALVGAYTLLSALLFPLFSLNSGAWRYASLLDVVSIVKAVTAITVAFALGNFLLFRGEYLPRTAVVMSFFVMIVALGGPRLFYRLLKERKLEASERQTRLPLQRNTLLYGFGDNADLFIRNARRVGMGGQIIGIVDDRPKNRRRQMHGVRVLGNLSQLDAVVRSSELRGTPATELIVTDTRLSPRQLAEVVSAAAPFQLTVKRLPDIANAGAVDENAPIEARPVSIEDLLGRKEVDLDTSEVARLIAGRRVLVTGAGGSIGSELTRQIARFNPARLVLVDSSEFNLWSVGRQVADEHPQVEFVERIMDVRRRARIFWLFEREAPDVIFHAAALKHVPIVEENPVEGIETNLIGTRNVADAALACRATAFVMVSTDKAVNPTNVMGATKRAAEAYCQALDLGSEATRFMTVRFGNVLGSTGSVIPLFRAQLARGGPLTVTHRSITRFFMTIPEASRLILHAAGHGLGDGRARGQIHVLDMGEPILIADLARRLIELAGLRPEIDIEIRYTGLRKGEKLYEELFSTEESMEPTGRAGFMTARSRVSDVSFLSRSFDTIEAALAQGDGPRAIEMLRRIVPEYRPEAAGEPDLRLVPTPRSPTA
ncbi:nucleoside-diphosphate sugar epimerase/dehydratase [Aurantimonas sp. Leaf443]|uniref:polysaccharide biosynthesis protein n=1 Tax=Aurantimonas sp. Leaf443 TaxID=1736378 RepID=UPI0006F9D6AE|nr:nucleoside-diphosphate sugar epimerase/dehydratase [Aurantimonas sp. Leaf443]KQT87917.1 polysaccharide biosynthesis protein [Aurantimonas sp. Leaf443]